MQCIMVMIARIRKQKRLHGHPQKLDPMKVFCYTVIITSVLSVAMRLTVIVTPVTSFDILPSSLASSVVVGGEPHLLIASRSL
jgi:hypothetical protein